MSTNTTTGPGGVKNLRAMFENRNSDQSTSPPSRGRSPIGSVSSVNSRPVSKVRASFVAVERPGEPGQAPQWGLRKASDVSSMASVREQAVLETASESMGSSIPRHGLPETLVASSDGPGLGAIMRGSPFESAENQVAPSAVAPINKKQKTGMAQGSLPTASKAGGGSENVADRIKKLQSNESVTASASKPESSKASNSKENKLPPSKLTIKPTTTQSKQSPTLTKSQPSSAKKVETTPTSATSTGPTFRPRGGVNKIKGIIESSNRAKEERGELAMSPSKIKPPSVASKPTAASRARESIDLRATPLEEPKVKSPTISTRIPSVATKTTASAVARKEANVEKEPAKPKPQERKTTVPQAPRVASANTRASLAKKTSRASIAPEDERPKSSARVSNVSRMGGDDSFLARMTRPTASTAQKAHDKLQLHSPPRPRQGTTSSRDDQRRPSRPSTIPAAKTGETSGDETLLGADHEPVATTEADHAVGNGINGHAETDSHGLVTSEALNVNTETEVPSQQAEVGTSATA